MEMSSSNPVRGVPLTDWLQPFDENLVDEEEQRVDRVEVYEDILDNSQPSPSFPFRSGPGMQRKNKEQKRVDQPTPRKGKANPNPKKEGPTQTRRAEPNPKGQPCLTTHDGVE